MNPLLAIGLALLIFIGNLIYSACSLRIVKEHSEKLSKYKALKEENLKIRAEIERMLNLRELERYALRKGFKPFSWEEFALFILREPSGRDRSKKRSR